ncbi:MAG: sigma-54 dependent transcriptional regulator [Deltaproteobacteria bacterium]|nr:sigma-54 dependent transcriptional regulator [Deltaproteobacteria bacterium]
MSEIPPPTTVLVIDDEESTRRMLRLLLTGLGYQVSLAPDGEAGLEVFARERPRLVVTDLKMPGLDGLEVLRRIKEASPATEVVVITGHGDLELAVEALKLDASDFLTKPIMAEALAVALERAAHKAQVQELLAAHTRNLECRVREATSELERTCRQLQSLGEITLALGGLSGVAEIGEYLLAQASALARFTPGGLVLFDARRSRLALWGRGRLKKLDSGWSEVVAALREPQSLAALGLNPRDLAPDEAGGENFLLAPMLLEGREAVGALILDPGGAEPSEEDLHVVLLLLAQAAGAVSRAVRQEEEMAFLQSQLDRATEGNEMVGSHPKWLAVMKLVAAVADTDSTVLITGESGTGKELVARRLHRLSSRRDAPFEVIHCAAYPQTLLESELFGHEKGAFTGAVKVKRGSFERADGGTVFLDELGEIPQTAQVKLLRVLQFREFQRLGGEKLLSVNVRVVAATSRDLPSEIATGNFREDLYYRLNVVPCTLPPLRERLSDVPALAAHFLRRLAERTGREPARLSPGALAALERYTWPGNVRELENALEHAFVVCRGQVLEPGDLPPALQTSVARPREAGLSLKEQEARHLAQALARAGGNRQAAARALGISRSTLYRKLEEHDLK